MSEETASKTALVFSLMTVDKIVPQQGGSSEINPKKNSRGNKNNTNDTLKSFIKN